jgi:hypothetical protein
MTFGEEGKEQARVHKLEDVNAILDVFQAHGHDEVCFALIIVLLPLQLYFHYNIPTFINLAHYNNLRLTPLAGMVQERVKNILGRLDGKVGA